MNDVKVTNTTLGIIATSIVAIAGMMTFLVYEGKEITALSTFIGSTIPVMILQILTLVRQDKANQVMTKIDGNVNGHLDDLAKAAGIPTSKDSTVTLTSPGV